MPGDLIPTNNIPAQPINTQAATQDIPKTVLEAFLSHYLQLTPSDNFDRALWSRLQIHSPQVDGDAVRTKYSISFPETCTNHHRTVHGGMITTLFDGLTSSNLALLDGENYWDGHEVSRGISVKFFRPIKLGEMVDAQCDLVHVGQNLACITGTLKRQSDGAILAACVHEKFNPVKAKL